MKYQRINLNPLARVIRPHGPHDGVPVRWSAPDAMDLPPLPSGEAWAEIHERPEAGTDYDPKTMRIERVIGQVDGTWRDGWRVVDLTPEELKVPSVTRRQLFLALANLDPPVTRSQIKQVIGSDEKALIEFEEALMFDRNHPLVGSLGAALSMDAPKIDQLFKLASQL